MPHSLGIPAGGLLTDLPDIRVGQRNRDICAAHDDLPGMRLRIVRGPSTEEPGALTSVNLGQI